MPVGNKSRERRVTNAAEGLPPRFVGRWWHRYFGGMDDLASRQACYGADARTLGRADDQATGNAGVARAEFQRHLNTVAPAAHHRTRQFQRRDQRCHIVGDQWVEEFTGRVRRPAVPATIWRDQAEAID